MSPAFEKTRRLGLGTVQFGLDYGVANKSGRVNVDEAARIVEAASRSGLQVLDTAYSYGSSEQVLGTLLHPDHRFRIITKTVTCRGPIVTAAHGIQIQLAFRQSLKRLNQSSVYGLLVHDADDLLKPGSHHIVAALRQLQSEELVEKIGFSAYTSDQVDRIIEYFHPDIVQIPLNVLDQRLVQSGTLTRLRHRGVEIHARSIFLQGLLLMDPNDLDPYFAPVRGHLMRIGDIIGQTRMQRLSAALRFVFDQETIDMAVVGVCSQRELLEVIDALVAPSKAIPFGEMALNDPKYVDPRNWRPAETAPA
ncbi:MAG: aldo/keto reductase [bacterium]